MTSWMDPMAAPHEAAGTSGEVIVLIHGFSGSAAHMRLLAARLEAEGHAVVVPALAGHGTSLADMARTGHFHWTASVEQALVSARTMGDRVHLVGFSMGGLLAINAASRHGSLSTLALLNVPYRFRNPAIYVAPFFAKTKPVYLWPEEQPPSGEVAPYWIQYPGFAVPAAGSLLHLRRAAIRNAGAVSIPALIVQSKADESVHPSSATRWAGILGGPTEYVWLAQARHLSLLSEERHTIHDAVAAHVASSSE